MKNTHSRRYIEWDKEAVKISISDPDEWNEKVATLNWDNYIMFEEAQIARVKTLRAVWIYGTWTYQFNGERPVVYIGYDIDNYEIWYFNPDNGQGIKGFAALKVLKEKMVETNGKKLQARFGALNQMDEEDLKLVQPLHNINRCVGPFIGNTSIRKNQYYTDKIYKADVSSAYPAEGIYNLPDLHTAELIRGYVEPSEEWPIVFYLESNHVAEYKQKPLNLSGEKKTLNKIVKPKRKNEHPVYFGFAFNDEPELCLRCKYSKYNLEEFLYFYDRKKEDELAKAVMNLAIGTFDFVVVPKGEVVKSKNSYFGHLRAIICGRHNHKMIEYYNEIEKKGYEVLQVQTDSIIWRGGPIDSAIAEKEIGKLHLEIENGRGFIHGCGAYWVEDENNRICKHQGIKNWSDDIDTLEKFKEFFESNEYKMEFMKIDPEKLIFEMTEA